MPYGEGSFRTSGGGRHRAPEQVYHASEQAYRASEQAYRAPDQAYRAPDQAYRAPDQVYRASDQAYRAPDQTYRAPEPAFQETLVPPDPGWDPAEELAFLLQDAVEQQHVVPPGPDAAPFAPAPGTPLSNLHEITAELPPLREPAPTSHRKVRRKVSRLRAASLFVAALAAVIAASVSLFGGMVAYEPLRLAAVARTRGSVVSWWPLLVYGPWLVASLAVLRAALHQRRAVHSWAVVLLFSAIAMLLCIAEAPKTVSDGAAAALPGLASLVCFQQIIRQITLTRPPRRAVPRHRQRVAATAGDGTAGADGTVASGAVSLPQQRHSQPRAQRPGTGNGTSSGAGTGRTGSGTGGRPGPGQKGRS